MTNTTSQVLARFVRDHGHPCRVLPDGSLRCAVAFGTHPSHKGFRWLVENVPANLQAVRDWLGY